MKRISICVTVTFLLLFIGNRVFNHVSAWGGIFIMATGIIYAFLAINKQLKQLIKDKEDEVN